VAAEFVIRAHAESAHKKRNRKSNLFSLSGKQFVIGQQTGKSFNITVITIGGTKIWRQVPARN